MRHIAREYCHGPEVIFNFTFEVEHIIPLCRGGEDDPSNLALACRSCNLYKADYLTGVDPTTHDSAPRFHPRQDAWDQHFQVDSETGFIKGATKIGRGTIARLQMNSSVQLAARKQWMRLGIFP